MKLNKEKADDWYVGLAVSALLIISIFLFIIA
jgi:hypothetical protein